jgi:hypothetical protein
MSLSLSQSYTAIVPGNTSSFLGSGGIPPYAYSVVPLGVGGTIDSVTGLYTAPSTVNAANPPQLYDTVMVTDSLAATATAQILVATPLFLFCDIIQTYMGLDNNHVYLWDQKVFQPIDSSLYVVVSVESCKPFGNNIENDGSGSGMNAIQYINMYNVLGLDIISRGPAARDQKELIIAALNSTYSQQQQQKNAFLIGRISTVFVNLSHVDGAAIPYRFHISVGFQYTVTAAMPVEYFDTFNSVTVDENP